MEKLLNSACVKKIRLVHNSTKIYGADLADNAVARQAGGSNYSLRSVVP